MNSIVKKISYLVFILVLFGFLSFDYDNTNQPEYRKKSYHIVLIETISNLIETIDNDTEQQIKQDQNGIYSSTMLGIFTNDSIYIYQNSLSNPVLYTLQKSDETNKLLLIYDDKSSSKDSLEFHFLENNIIAINENRYNLDKEGFDYLYKKGFEERSIMALVGILTPNIEDFYSFNVLINYPWLANEGGRKCRILSSQVKTRSPSNSDYIFHWQVNYSYTNNEVTHIEKIDKDDQSSYLDIRLIKEDSLYRQYSYSYVDDIGRFTKEGIIYRNKVNAADSVKWEETRSAYTSLYLHYPKTINTYTIDKLNLTKSEIKEFLVTKNLSITD